MKNWLIKNRLYVTGALLGAVGGFLYWKFVGCVTGTCAITGKPINSTLYFAVMGSLLFGMFKKEKQQKEL
ncbi:MAG: hypothetical protein ABI861_14350 [Panacibacter sp.]